MGKIFLVGDTHGSHSIKKIGTKEFPEGKNLTKKDVVIQLGDFGNYWWNDKEENYWLEWIAEKPFTFAFLDGNHENHEMIWNLPTDYRWGGKVHVDKRKYGEIIYLKRGEIYTINDKKILVIGGAKSHDQHLRTEGHDWWPTEILSHEDKMNTYDNIDKHNREVDYILSHTTPDYLTLKFTENVLKLHDPVSEFLEIVDNLVTFKEWHFGHHHRDIHYINENGEKYACHYKEVYEL